MSKWKNAPVAYVIVQVRFSPILSLQSYLPQIQENFRRMGFPAFNTRFNFQLAATIPQLPSSDEGEASPIPVERTLSYVFSSRDKTRSFVLERNGLTLHVTDYEDSQWFIDLFMSHLTHVEEILKPDSSERIGMRYIDVVTPRSGSSVGVYLKPEVLGLSQYDELGTLQHSLSETVMQEGESFTATRVIARNGPVVFPPDMLSLPVSVNPRFTTFTGSHAVLDTDSFQASSVPMDIAGIRDRLATLHELVDRAFTIISTEHARKDWKGEMDGNI